MTDKLRTGIIGAGFIGTVHAHAVRAAGGLITRVADSSPEKAVASARRLGAVSAAESAEALITDDEVDVVHICTPNATHAVFAEDTLKAGKSVICEKPLATSVEDAERLAAQARNTGALASVPFVYRFYPTVREARARIASGDAGRLWLLHGSYLQDWLSREDETNWRVDASKGGGSRAFGDIGVHWCDLMEFTTGHKITRLVAGMPRAYDERAARGNGSGHNGAVATEDGATVLFETDRGASGSVVVSQVSPGRKNRLWFSFDGTAASYAFDQEHPDVLWVGGRDENALVTRGPDTLTSPGAQRYARLPAGHPQGYQDCFNAFVVDAYAAVSGDRPEDLPTFEDGLRAAVLTQSVINSAKSNGWVEVPR